MRNPSNPPVGASAELHAARILARGEESTEGRKPAAGQSTAERYAARILPGIRADEALREQARRNELRARGVWTPGDEEELEDAVEEEEEILDDQDDGEDDAPPSTAERYARVERERRAAERQANARAQSGMVRGMAEPLVPQYRPIVVHPHRYAHVWQQSAS